MNARSAAPLKILHLLTHTRIGSGGAIQAWLVSRELAKLGHSVTFALQERHGRTDAATKARVESIGCRYVGLPLSGLSGVAAVRRLIAERFDVVHLHRELALTQYLRAAPFAPDGAAIANVGTSKPPNLLQAWRLKSRRIDRIVVVAEALKTLLATTAGVAPVKISTVYGAFDEQRFHAEVEPYDRTREFGVPADAKIVGVVANLDSKKGHKFFVRAAAQVLKQRDDCWFICAGGGDIAKLERRAALADLPADRLIALGFRDDVPRLLKTFDLSVCASSRGEGLTGALRESLAVGTPVVSTSIAGNVELVRHKETGLLVPPMDPDALARAILESLDDPAASRSRAQAGQAIVRARFTSAARARHMERVYRDVLAMRRASDPNGAAIDGDRGVGANA